MSEAIAVQTKKTRLVIFKLFLFEFTNKKENGMVKNQSNIFTNKEGITFNHTYN
jgi:hypothetical protein